MELGQGQERKIELKNPDDPAAATILKRKVILAHLNQYLRCCRRQKWWVPANPPQEGGPGEHCRGGGYESW